MRQLVLAAPLVLAAALGALVPAGSPALGATDGEPGSAFVLLVHGGAGTLLRQDITPELEAQIRADLTAALEAGSAVLAGGGASLDAVVATVRVLEDSPLFNAGRGAVFTADGTQEMDAAVMDGARGTAGAVTGVSRVKNPILAARAVMESTPHVLLAGAAAERLAFRSGLEMADPAYFFSQRRWDQLQRARGLVPATAAARARDGEAEASGLGTVGAVALDRQGHLAAATSTGGLTNKLAGRIGDTPLVGAGTYADDGCAVSGTGHGESFIRHVVAHDICARMRYGGVGLAEAARRVVDGVLAVPPAEGGVIALDAQGHQALVFNTPGMYRGYVHEGAAPVVAIFKD